MSLQQPCPATEDFRGLLKLSTTYRNPSKLANTLKTLESRMLEKTESSSGLRLLDSLDIKRSHAEPLLRALTAKVASCFRVWVYL